MTPLPAPEPEFQLRFLREIQRILDEGMFSSSYKFALIHAEKAGAFIIAIGTETMNVGMLKMDLKDAISSFEGEMNK